MDLTRILQQLYAEKERLLKAIAILDQMIKESPDSRPRSQRGRKSMGDEERKAVAQRMKRYWTKKREQSGSGDAANAKTGNDHSDRDR